MIMWLVLRIRKIMKRTRLRLRLIHIRYSTEQLAVVGHFRVILITTLSGMFNAKRKCRHNLVKDSHPNFIIHKYHLSIGYLNNIL
jgi:hypothetical protein